MEQQWATVFGCSADALWDGLQVTAHSGLGDYPGILVAARGTGCRVSVPQGWNPEFSESLSRQGISDLLSVEFWASSAATEGLQVIGPSAHAYADTDPGTSPPGVLRGHLETCEEDVLEGLHQEVTEADWLEGGFADGGHALFALRDDTGAVVAAANLTDYAGVPSDVGVLVHPRHRGKGLGREVARAATSHAVRTFGLARWRARASNLASLGVAASLGFEPYCRQLAVRPADR